MYSFVSQSIWSMNDAAHSMFLIRICSSLAIHKPCKRRVDWHTPAQAKSQWPVTSDQLVSYITVGTTVLLYVACATLARYVEFLYKVRISGNKRTRSTTDDQQLLPDSAQFEKKRCGACDVCGLMCVCVDGKRMLLMETSMYDTKYASCHSYVQFSFISTYVHTGSHYVAYQIRVIHVCSILAGLIYTYDVKRMLLMETYFDIWQADPRHHCHSCSISSAAPKLSRCASKLQASHPNLPAAGTKRVSCCKLVGWRTSTLFTVLYGLAGWWASSWHSSWVTSLIHLNLLTYITYIIVYRFDWSRLFLPTRSCMY
jgi:hypothetical protein